jgi:Asp-tRNA(Asn)/Glu-tRNA(Gln) amidotransferase A subunit family amidase
VIAGEDNAFSWFMLSPGPDAGDVFSTTQPDVRIPDVSELALLRSATAPLKGVKIGIYWEWFNHADPTIVKTCKNAVEYLEKQGAQIVEIQIAHLEEMKLAQLITIGSEMASGVHFFYDNYSHK